MHGFTQDQSFFKKFKMHTEATISALFDYIPQGELDNQYRIDTITHIQKNPASWWQRGTLDGHVTASAWILNEEKTHALFLHHAKINRWFQPGGHLDETDISPAQGAIREAREETGIANLTLDEFHKGAIFDVDVHLIAAHKHEAAHLHYDLRYLVQSAETTGTKVTISHESLGFRWISLKEVAEQFEPSLARMAKKTLQTIKNTKKPEI